MTEAIPGKAVKTLQQKGPVLVAEQNLRFTRAITAGQHTWLADEPVELGGDDCGPGPYELLLAALGACTSMTVRMYANHKQWPLEDIRVELNYVKEADSGAAVVERFHRTIELTGNALTDEQRARLLDVANKCPVHKTLSGKIVIVTELSAANNR